MGPRCLRAALLPLLLLLELPGARGDCGPPPRFAFAEPPLPLNDSYPSGTSLRYRCRTGYTVASGKSPYVTCLPNSTWSAESDFCIGKLCSPPDIPNGKFDYVTDLRFGAVINFACNEGYRLIGDSSAECVLQGSDVTWSQVPYCEIIPCMPPPRIENGELNAESRDFTFGSTVTYSCHVGFSLIGESSIHCTSDDNLNGKWSGPAPECKVVSCQNPQVENGEKVSGFGTEYTYKETVTFQCKAGHALIGSSIVTCEANSTWTPPLPTCDPRKLCSPPDIPNGKFDYVTDLRFGAVINFACNEGYRLIGDSSAECILQGSDVTWSQVPYCEIIPCMPPPGIENGELNAESRDFTFGSTVTYSCHVGFSLIGESSIHCTSDDNLNGKWSGPAPECKVIGCTSPPAIANGEFSAGSRVFTLGSTVTYSCHRGFSLIGESTIHCISDDNLNGKWSGTAPECKGAANKIIAGILPLLLAILAFHF
ncbi:complement receptor type 1-like [Dromaius novaehollandiae]|uniref:complement receptor type 1-like n=1 Tax=Dromaius novaehollandiae TaxID=8790 RepID=UPI00311E9E73